MRGGAAAGGNAGSCPRAPPPPRPAASRAAGNRRHSHPPPHPLAKRVRSISLCSGGDVGADDDGGAVGELRETAGRDLLSLAHALANFDPAVAEVDAEDDGVLVRDAAFDEEELRDAGEHRDRRTRHRERALVLLDDDVAVAEEAGAEAMVR